MRQMVQTLFGSHSNLSFSERWKFYQGMREFQKFLKPLGPLAAFKPCAYVIDDLNLLVVTTKDCSYTLVEEPPFLGGVRYENNELRREPVGMQIFGASLIAGCPSVREAVETIAQEVGGGMTTIFGSALEDARTVLAAYGHLRIA